MSFSPKSKGFSATLDFGLGTLDYVFDLQSSPNPRLSDDVAAFSFAA